MSDQQPTPETPRPVEPGAAAPPPGAPVPPTGPDAPAAPTPAPASPEAAPPVWPAHAQGAPAGQAPAPQAPGYPTPGYPAQGYPAPGYGYPPAQTTSTNAVVGLVLAIISWVVCPVIPAIVALVLAKKSGEEIAASQGRVGGEGLNTATKIISWINIGFYAALILIGGAFFLIAIVLGAASSATS